MNSNRRDRAEQENFSVRNLRMKLPLFFVDQRTILRKCTIFFYSYFIQTYDCPLDSTGDNWYVEEIRYHLGERVAYFFAFERMYTDFLRPSALFYIKYKYQHSCFFGFRFMIFFYKILTPIHCKPFPLLSMSLIIRASFFFCLCFFSCGAWNIPMDCVPPLGSVRHCLLPYSRTVRVSRCNGLGAGGAPILDAAHSGAQFQMGTHQLAGK
jgi:hypothetical protein